MSNDSVHRQLTKLFREAMHDSDPNCVDDAAQPENLADRAMDVLRGAGWVPPEEAESAAQALFLATGTSAVLKAGLAEALDMLEYHGTHRNKAEVSRTMTLRKLVEDDKVLALGGADDD